MASMIELAKRVYTGSLLISYGEDMQKGETPIRKAQASMAVFMITQFLSFLEVKKIVLSRGNMLCYDVDWVQFQKDLQNWGIELIIPELQNSTLDEHNMQSNKQNPTSDK